MEDHCTISTSTGTIRPLHIPPVTTEQRPLSQPSSPRSALPSPPDSPSGESVSSLPSVSSSFFYSSGAASPRHQHSDHSRGELDQLRLVIPSLTLPSALPHATTYGQTLGDLKLLILGGKGIGKTTLANLLLESNDDVVEIGGWEYLDEGRANVLRASTDWIEHRDAHGLNKFEPARNVEIIELPGYDQYAEVCYICKTSLYMSIIAHLMTTSPRRWLNLCYLSYTHRSRPFTRCSIPTMRLPRLLPTCYPLHTHHFILPWCSLRQTSHLQWNTR